MKSEPDQTKLCFNFPLFLTIQIQSRAGVMVRCAGCGSGGGGGVAGGARGPCEGRVMGPGCNHHQISPDQQSAATGYTGHIRYVSRG